MYLKNRQLVLSLQQETLRVVKVGHHLELFCRLQQIVCVPIEVLYLRPTAVVARPQGKVVFGFNWDRVLLDRLVHRLDVAVRAAVLQVHIRVLLVDHFDQLVEVAEPALGVLVAEVVAEGNQHVTAAAVIVVPSLAELHKRLCLLVFVLLGDVVTWWKQHPQKQQKLVKKLLSLKNKNTFI